MTAGVIKRFLSQIKSKKRSKGRKHLTYDDEYESDNVDQNDVVWMKTCCSRKEIQVKNVLSLDPKNSERSLVKCLVRLARALGFRGYSLKFRHIS